jgi:hypothetical protein
MVRWQVRIGLKTPIRIAVVIALLVIFPKCSKDDRGTNGGGGDKTPPTIAITYPLSGFSVSDTVMVSADGSDNVGFVRVDFFLDGRLVFADSNPPWQYSWDCTLQRDSSQHALYAKVYDAAGNTSTSPVQAVTVRNQMTEAPRGLGRVGGTRHGSEDPWHLIARQKSGCETDSRAIR